MWVAEEDGKIHGVLVAFAAHGFFQPIRVVGREGGRWLYGLIKKAFKDAFDRGYYYFVIPLDRSPFGVSVRDFLSKRGASVNPDGWVGGAIAPIFGIRRAKQEQERVAC